MHIVVLSDSVPLKKFVAIRLYEVLVTKQKKRSPNVRTFQSDHKTKRNINLPVDCVVAAVLNSHVKIEVSFETAWYTSAKRHAHVSDGGVSATRLQASAALYQSVRAEHL